MKSIFSKSLNKKILYNTPIIKNEFFIKKGGTIENLYQKIINDHNYKNRFIYLLTLECNNSMLILRNIFINKTFIKNDIQKLLLLDYNSKNLNENATNMLADNIKNIKIINFPFINEKIINKKSKYLYNEYKKYDIIIIKIYCIDDGKEFLNLWMDFINSVMEKKIFLYKINEIKLSMKSAGFKYKDIYKPIYNINNNPGYYNYLSFSY